MYLSLVLGLGKKIGIKNPFLSAYTQANAKFLPVKGKGLPVHVYGFDCTSHNVKRKNGHSFFFLLPIFPHPTFVQNHTLAKLLGVK